MNMATTTMAVLETGKGAPGSGGSGPMLCLENVNSVVDEHDKPNLIMTPSSDSSSNAHQSTVQNGDSYAKNKEEITFLVEVVKATIPKRRGRRDDNSRGMHCTATWVGPTNPSGRKRMEKLVHRTKTLKIDHKADADA
ncbi:hypothetical protein ACHAXR_011721 [Thalassiosira sp. AJA248-18]